MKSNSNIVQLNPVRGGEPQAHLPLPLIRLRDTSAEQLKALLGRMFDSADDALFELADRAGSNADQSLYFDAMREIRLKRKQIEMTFLQGVTRAFADLSRERPEARSEAAVDFDTLGLVQNDELEERVAIDSMVSRASAQHGLPLQHLTLRIDCLMRPRAVADADNPLGPRVLCQAFRASCQELTVEIRAKLVLLKLFEKFTLSKLQELYVAANNLLVEQGVMPDLKSGIKAAPRTAPGVRRSATTGPGEIQQAAAIQGDGREVFNVLQELLAEQRAEGVIPTLMPLGAGQGTLRGGTGAVPHLSQDDLVRLLSQAQHHPGIAPDAFNQNANGLIDYRALLPGLLQQAGRQGQVRQVDGDVINLVAMLFEFILDDRQLPSAMKALIARLQIPMLKVALLDKTFFSKRGHPARRLLNELATAAIGWNEKANGERDPLRERIEAVVERLTQDFEADIQVIEDVLADFQRFVETEQRRGQLVEQRIRDAEEGRAKSDGARRDVRNALDQALAGRDVPEVVLKLLQEGWSNLMVLQHLKHGVDSEAWTQAVTFAQDLIWSVCPPPERHARRRLLQMIPGLLKGLRQGLAVTSMSPFEMDRLLKQLEAIHLDVLQRLLNLGKPADEAAVPANQQAMPAETGTEREQPTAASIETPVLAAGVVPVAAPAPVARVSMPAPEVAAPTSTVEEGVSVEEGISVEGKAAVEQALAVDDIDERYLRRVDGLQSGCWVEFFEDDGKKFRAKLVAVIKATGNYIFVNRAGVKVAEKSRLGLAVALRDGRINPLDDGLLFDRALESVIGNLRATKRA